MPIKKQNRKTRKPKKQVKKTRKQFRKTPHYSGGVEPYNTTHRDIDSYVLHFLPCKEGIKKVEIDLKNKKNPSAYNWKELFENLNVVIDNELKMPDCFLCKKIDNEYFTKYYNACKIMHFMKKYGIHRKEQPLKINAELIDEITLKTIPVIHDEEMQENKSFQDYLIQIHRLTHIKDDAFLNNKLKNVIIPDSVITIGESAFSNNQLTNITIPNSVTTIGDYAFAANELTSVVIPDSVTSIGEEAFTENHLTTVIIPNSVTSIGEEAFAKNQLENVIISDSVTTIGQRAFAENELTSVVIPDSVTTIHGGAFLKNRLTSVVIPNSVTSIGEYAFDGNPLTSVTLPSNFDSIKNDIFFNTDKITFTYT